MNQTVTAIDSCQEISRKQKQLIENLPIYCNMALGGSGYKPMGQLYIRLAERQFVRSKTTQEVLFSPGFKFTLRFTYQKLVLVTPAQMGLESGGLVQDIEARAVKLGLLLVPMDTAPCMMLQMPSSNWSKHHSIIVASEPVIHSQTPYIFDVSKDALQAVSGHQNNHWHHNQAFLFRRP